MIMGVVKGGGESGERWDDPSRLAPVVIGNAAAEQALARQLAGLPVNELRRLVEAIRRERIAAAGLGSENHDV